MRFRSYIRDLRPCVVVLAFGITVLQGSLRSYGVIFILNISWMLIGVILVDRFINFYGQSSGSLDLQQAHTTFRQKILIR